MPLRHRFPGGATELCCGENNCPLSMNTSIIAHTSDLTWKGRERHLVQPSGTVSNRIDGRSLLTTRPNSYSCGSPSDLIRVSLGRRNSLSVDLTALIPKRLGPIRVPEFCFPKGANDFGKGRRYFSPIPIPYSTSFSPVLE